MALRRASACLLAHASPWAGTSCTMPRKSAEPENSQKMALPSKASSISGSVPASIGSRSLSRQHSDSVDLNQVVRRCHLADLDHRRSRQRRLEVLGTYLMDRVEVLHVADIDIDPADVVEGSARGLDGAFQVFADLSGLRGDIAQAGDAAVHTPCCHSGDEHEPSGRLDHCGMREDAARLPQLGTRDLALRHAVFPSSIVAAPAPN